MFSEYEILNKITNSKKKIFYIKSELKSKLNFLKNNNLIKPEYIHYGINYLKKISNNTKYSKNNIQLYTICSIILTNKYLEDYDDTKYLLQILDLPRDIYIKKELEILSKLNYSMKMTEEDNNHH
jgi:hypothetical protein